MVARAFVAVASCSGALVFSTADDAGPKAQPGSDYRWASAEAVSRWHDLKFGLRIHWGGYAMHGIGPESWPLHNANGNQTFLKWYWDGLKNWNPKKFDPASWISLMSRAGIKYFDFTTKHHEGFSMYDTAANVHDCWDFDVSPGAKTVKGIVQCPGGTDGHPFSSMEVFGRDVVGELVAAARAGGVQPGLYFSHIDWYDADMRIDQWNAVAGPSSHLCDGTGCDPKQFNPAVEGYNKTQWQRFVLRHRAQVMETLSKYGEIFEMSFDMNFPPEFDQEMYDTISLARLIAPNTLFRGRGMGGYKGSCDERISACGMGDYETPEEIFPDRPVPGNWQVIYHGSNFMSFDPDAANYVNGSFIVWHLVDIVSKGGLMQIGYGPDANGEFHPRAVEALEYAGRWLAVNGEAIYSTHPMPMHWNDTASTQVRYTRSKDNTTIYATALSGFGSAPTLGSLPLADVTPDVGSQVFLLGYEDERSREPLPVHWETQGGKAVLTIPADITSHPAIMNVGLCFKITGKPIEETFGSLVV